MRRLHNAASLHQQQNQQQLSDSSRRSARAQQIKLFAVAFLEGNVLAFLFHKRWHAPRSTLSLRTPACLRVYYTEIVLFSRGCPDFRLLDRVLCRIKRRVSNTFGEDPSLDCNCALVTQMISVLGKSTDCLMTDETANPMLFSECSSTISDIVYLIIYMIGITQRRI